jgi:hypothetical protein
MNIIVASLLLFVVGEGRERKEKRGGGKERGRRSETPIFRSFGL